jgi:hypothetical protein
MRAQRTSRAVGQPTAPRRTDQHDVTGLLALQRRAGNRAVAHQLASGARTPQVQRCGGDQHAGCPCADGPAEGREEPLQRSAATAEARLLVSRQTDAEVMAAGAERPAWLGSEHALNLLLHRHFPAEEARIYAGSGVGAATAGVTADLTARNVGQAILLVGTQYGPTLSPATLPSRVTELRQVLVQVMVWRISNGWLTQADLAFPEVSATLRATDPLALRQLTKSPNVDGPAGDTVRQLLAISTPVGAAATLQADGSATETAGGVLVRLLPDRRAGTQNETSVSFDPPRPSVPGFRHRRGLIAEVLGPLPVAPEVRIQTTYAAAGPQAGGDPATVPSAYGSGTTTADRAAGRTSLRHHEGSHGTVFLQFFRTHPYRPFSGAVGMTRASWQAEQQAYLRAYAAWAREATVASTCQVDCVGFPTKDQFHATTRGHQLECTACPTP